MEYKRKRKTLQLLPFCAYSLRFCLVIQIRSKDVVRFQMSLTTILKAHIDNLKKREKPKKKTKKLAADS